MSDPSSPGGPLEGPGQEEPRGPNGEADCDRPRPPNTAWSAPEAGWETPGPPSPGWGPPPPPTGWTRLPDGSWNPPPPEATWVAPGSPWAAPQQGRSWPGVTAPSRQEAPGRRRTPRGRHRLARIAVAGLLVACAALLGVAMSRDFWQPKAATSSQSQPAGSGTSGSAQTLPSGNGGGGSGRGGSAGSSTGSGSSGSPSSVSSIASSVSPALVDINAALGYQFGRAAATGIVLTPSGVVLTNNHVIAGATSLSATDVGNGRTYRATVLGYDRTHDVALIRLDGASGLQAAQLGDSSKAAVGQKVVAIGNAGGVGGTPSAAGGSIVALGRQITASDESGRSERLSGLLQTNADIQPGDSGGPLVNTAGQVIGIDTAASGGYLFRTAQNQGFAVPVNAAMAIARQIQNRQSSATVHIGATAFLGVTIDTSAGQGLGFGFGGSSGSSASGVQIAGTLSGGPAARAGLAARDTIVSIDGQAVDSPAALTGVLGFYHPGDTVKLGWIDQSGARHTTTVRLASGPPA